MTCVPLGLVLGRYFQTSEYWKLFTKSPVLNGTSDIGLYTAKNYVMRTFDHSKCKDYGSLKSAHRINTVRICELIVRHAYYL